MMRTRPLSFSYESPLSTFRGLLLLIITALVVAAMAEDLPIVEQQQQQRVGGYAAIPDLTDERVVNAAHFAVEALQQQRSTDAHFSFQSKLLPASNLQVTVVRGFRQVVAGMNYKLVVVVSKPRKTTSDERATAVTDDGVFVGSFAVAVYDHFGELSVTKWGQELTQEKAKAILETRSDFGEDDSDKGDVGL